jgi:biotin carboxyl carrier protein
MCTNVAAHMPGIIGEILVNVGDQVQADDGLIILEAMKMENPVCHKGRGAI